MRIFEVIVALIVGATAFVVVKILGLVLQLALVAGGLGLIAGFAIAGLFRRK